VAEQSAIAGLVSGVSKYLNTAPAGTNSCAPKRFIVLITDGLPTKDMAGHNWPPLGSISASGANTNPTGPGWNVWATFNADGSLKSTNDQALTDAIGQITAAAGNNVQTYVIGLGAGVGSGSNTSAANSLTAMAVAGGTGGYFPANSPDQLIADLQVILQDILNANQSAASATVNTTGLNTTSTAFQPSFNTSDQLHDWTGDIQAYPISAATGLVSTTLSWSAQTQLDVQSAGSGWQNRVIATWDPAAKAAIPFEWNPSGTVTTGIAQNSPLGALLQTNVSDTNGQDALDYLRGDAAFSLSGTGTYRNRTHVLGDIVDSAPIYIGMPSGPYQSSTYYTFVNKYKGRTPVLYAGANDGMLHAFNASNGQEMFAYIPNGVFANLINLTNPYYNQQHQFFVDGPPQAGDVQFSDTSWHTVLVSGEHGGGNTVFALDVTDPGSINNEAQLAGSVLWEFSDPNMGLSYSNPVIAQTMYGSSGSNLGFTVFFGNGYNSPSQTPYLYAVDPQTGKSLPGTPINLCAAVPTACNSSLPNGLSSVTVTNNLGGIGAAVTTLYAGDLQGNLWRVDVSNSNSAAWTVTVLFQAIDPSGAPQPITTTPAISLNPRFPLLPGTMVYVGTGQLLSVQDLTSTQIQTMYGVYDSDSNSTLVSRKTPSMAQQTLSPCPATGTCPAGLRFVQGSQIALPAQSGWYVDLDIVDTGGNQTDPGERIIADPRLIGGAVSVITVQPSTITGTTAMAVGPHGSPLDSTPSAQQSRSLLARARPYRPRPPRGLSWPPLPEGASTSPDRVVYLDTAPMVAGAEPSSNAMPSAHWGYRDSWTAPHVVPVVLGVGTPPVLTSCAITPANPTINLGAGGQFTYVGTFSDGSTQNLTAAATWSSSNAAAATIGATGQVTSAGLGTTTITGTIAPGAITPGPSPPEDPTTVVTCSTTLTVVNPPPPPTLTGCGVWPPNPTIYLPGQQQFSVYGIYSNGGTAWTSGTWTSSNTGVATITATGGLATAQALGTTTITATIAAGAYTCSTTLTVATRPTLLSIQVVPPNPSIVVGATKQFTANGIYSNGSVQNLTNQVTWSSSDVAVATIAVHGLASGVLAGQSTITASLGAVSGSTSLTVVAPTNAPPPQCPNGPVSYLMEFNFAGGAFSTPVFNYNGPGTSMSALLPANGMLLGSVYASAEVFNNFATGINGTGGAMGFITESNQTILSIYQFGMNRQRYSWWEIR
jgi:hypothetical protein